MKYDDKPELIYYLFGAVPVIWLALLCAPYAYGGLPTVIWGLAEVLNNPFSITWQEDSFQTVLLFLLAYGIGVGVYLASKGKYRLGEEHGSSQWTTPRELNKTYASKNKSENRIFTQNVSMSLDGHFHQKNLHTLVVGGPGSGKSRFYAKPNLLQGFCSYFVLDPKGELLRDTGAALKAMGYKIKVLDLLHMEKSHCYNPFAYLTCDNDVQRMVTALFQSTGQKEGKSADPFWDTAAQMLLMSLCMYLYHEAPPEEQNFAMVMEMLRYGEVREEDETYQSPLDLLFIRLEMRNPEHIAVKYYKNYHSGAGKTLKSIQITLAARLEKFNLHSLVSLTAYDEMELSRMGEEKVALFALIPDNDKSFNFIISMLYIQMFQQLFYQADTVHKGQLPVHVHFLMDEFANVSLPDDFPQVLATMRSRNISASIILQNISQLKALFKDHWESIVGSCDSLLYLGGNEQSTHKLLSDLMGKGTIDTKHHGKSTGRNGNYSTNFQNLGRELLTPAEVRSLNKKKALLLISGEPPVLDHKYNLNRHPNVALGADGGAENFVHGVADHSDGTIEFVFDKELLQQATTIEPLEGTDLQLLDETELEESLYQMEEIYL